MPTSFHFTCPKADISRLWVFRLIAALLTLCTYSACPAWADAPQPMHGIAMHGAPQYPANFTHFRYVNPQAPKGGALRLHAIGTFDTLNPYTLKGMSAAGLGLTYDTLMTSAMDEAFTEYGLIAHTITVPENRAWVRFDLRTEARWHDGKPITPADVVFSFYTLKDKGDPFYRSYYAGVAKVEASGPHAVTFTFHESGNRELPLIIGQMPILPAHYWKDRDFAATTLEPPLGSGPYRIVSAEAGRSIVYERVKDYWGKALPVNVGRYNPDTVRFDYYRDTTVALEAFKAGAFDIMTEYEAKKWATAYDFPAVAEGRVIRAEIPHHTPSGMQGFAFNIRRPVFKDPRVREALAYAFDFEWTNAALFHGAYRRINSYFDNSELAATALPDAAERAILEPFRAQVPPEVFTTVYAAPKVEGELGLRTNLKRAITILKSAGWTIQNGRMTETATGHPLRFEIMINGAQGAAFERITLPFIQNLKKIGVEASLRSVDVNQFQNRVRQFDFDIMVASFGQSLSPGNEQDSFFGSAAADRPGSRNVIGIKSPAIDAIIRRIVMAQDRPDLIAATRALDRVLLWSHYVIPQWYLPYSRIAYWNRFGLPGTLTIRGTDTWTWWIDTQKDAALKRE
ncbi:MAG: ABC transporter substrate-binding protein [Rhodospirillaceae bacterium]|nr:ABC transporter substrate-binding protein [Rhodospirillaceae bacterium]